MNECHAPGCIRKVLVRCTGCHVLSCPRHCWRGDSRVLPHPGQDYHEHTWERI